MGNDRGQVIIFVTLFLVLLLLFSGIGIDTGWMAYVRNQGQASVDAAALSAASALPPYVLAGDRTKVDAMVAAFNGTNFAVNPSSSNLSGNNVTFMDYSPQTGSVAVAATSSSTDAVRVALEDNNPFPGAPNPNPQTAILTPLFFARLIGRISARINVSAIAVLGGPSQGEGRFPLSLRECAVPRDASGKLDCSGVPQLIQSPEASDNSAFTTFGTTGGNDCRQYVNGQLTPPPISYGDTINLVGSGQTTSCLVEMYDALQPKLPEGWKVLIPIIDCDGNQSNGTVVGWATITITDITIPPAEKTISASLACNLSAPGAVGGGEFFGTFAERPMLVR